MQLLFFFPLAWPFLVLWGLYRLFRWSWVAGLLVLIAFPFAVRALVEAMTAGAVG